MQRVDFMCVLRMVKGPNMATEAVAKSEVLYMYIAWYKCHATVS